MKVVRVLLLATLAAASLLIVVMSVGAVMFSAGTSVGTEQDQVRGLKAAGFWLVVASSVPLGWIVYGLRGVWRVVFATPCVLLIGRGLLWIFPV